MHHLGEVNTLFDVLPRCASVSIPIDHFHCSVVELMLLFYVCSQRVTGCSTANAVSIICCSCTFRVNEERSRMLCQQSVWSRLSEPLLIFSGLVVGVDVQLSKQIEAIVRTRAVLVSFHIYQLIRWEL